MLQSLDATNRRIAMTSASGVTSQDTANARHLQESLNALRQRQQPPRLVTSPDDRAALERALRPRPAHLGRFLVGHHLQHALAATALRAEPEPRVNHGPKPWKNAGQVEGRLRTAPGYTVPVGVPYYRRQGPRRAGNRDAGG